MSYPTHLKAPMFTRIRFPDSGRTMLSPIGASNCLLSVPETVLLRPVFCSESSDMRISNLVTYGAIWLSIFSTPAANCAETCESVFQSEIVFTKSDGAASRTPKSSKTARVINTIADLGKPIRSTLTEEPLQVVDFAHSKDGQSSAHLIRSIKRSEYEYDDFFVEILQPVDQFLAGRPDPSKPIRDQIGDFAHVHQIPDALQSHMDRVFESLNFVFKIYRERKGWPDRFLRELALAAVKYTFHSTYINVREKTLEGKPGRLLGTERQLDVPYLRKNSHEFDGEDIKGLQSAWVRAKLRSESGFVGFNLKIPSRFRDDPMWKALFPNGRISDSYMDTLKARRTNSSELTEVREEGVRLPLPQENQDLTYIPTAMELVLKSKYGMYRDGGSQSLHRVIEPGNFAVDKEQAHWVSVPLYYHMARLSRSSHLEPGSGSTTRILTYAEKGSLSAVFYRSLGLQVLDESSNHAANPTHAVWNILGGDADALTFAYRKRFGIPQETDLKFSRFDEFESQNIDWRKPAEREQLNSKLHQSKPSGPIPWFESFWIYNRRAD